MVIDEQLFPTKARCRFTQYMSSKPDIFGQTFWLAVDNDSKYLVHALPYLGKDDQRKDNDRLADHVVKQLVGPFLNKERNLPCDNYFTLLRLADHLKSKDTTLVGTVNKSRKEVPNRVKNAREVLYESKIYKNNDVSLTVYQGGKIRM